MNPKIYIFKENFRVQNFTDLDTFCANIVRLVWDRNANGFVCVEAPCIQVQVTIPSIQ